MRAIGDLICTLLTALDSLLQLDALERVQITSPIAFSAALPVAFRQYCRLYFGRLFFPFPSKSLLSYQNEISYRDVGKLSSRRQTWGSCERRKGEVNVQLTRLEPCGARLVM